MIIGKKIKIFIITLIGVWFLVTVYRYSPYKIEYLGYYNKIWAHRVDSKEKLNSALTFFKGVELDLVYDPKKKILDVTHPPVPTINLNLQDYLYEIDQTETPNLWLDIKNLTLENEEAILARLLHLFSEKIPLNKILVETQNPETLPIFAQAGFNTSYYLPTGLSTKNKSDLKDEIKKIKEILSTQPTLAISSSYKDYELMQKHFPNTKKYTWIINSVFKHGFKEPRKILRDTTVQAVLIRYVSIKGNR